MNEKEISDTADSHVVSAVGRTAVVCIAKDEDLYLYEWLDYHFRLGFDDAYVYTNDWRYTGLVPDIAGHKVVFTPWDGVHRQMAAYNDFIQRFSSAYDWAAFIDVDEYVANNTDKTFKECLQRYSDFLQLAVNWRILGDSGIKSYNPAYSSLAFRFTWGGRNLNRHVKQFIHFAAIRAAGVTMPVFGGSMHCTTSASRCYDGRGQGGPFNGCGLDVVHPLELYHYRVKTEEEFVKIRVPRGRNDLIRVYKPDCNIDTGASTPGVNDYGRSAYNINEVECNTVAAFYWRALQDACPARQAGQA